VLLSVVNSSHNSTAGRRQGRRRPPLERLPRGGGGGVRRPFGDAALDGVDFYLDGGGAEQERFSDLVRRRLQAIRSSSGGGLCLERIRNFQGMIVDQLVYIICTVQIILYLHPCACGSLAFRD
jgi:hypothetical protein